MADDQEQLAHQIRVNVAFEQMIVSVLAGAFVAGAFTLILDLGVAIAGSVVSFSVLLAAVLETFLVSFLVFISGFLASILIGVPLFIALEKSKRRTMWPYLGVSIGVSITVFSFIAGHIPIADDFNASIVATIFAPAIVIAFVFGRLMQPIWRAAILADEAKEKAERSKAIVVRLH